ncbi:hypothetical protein EBB07_21270 [Paenibacillaceae bacterium]|nr:hypothetical protein EBB07_21270 [Paenibacillaceae bacterium]
MYPIIQLPFEVIPFEIMKKREADQYLNWFVSIQSERIERLAYYYEHTNGGKKHDLDFTQNSLINLWDWFVPRIEHVKKTWEELNEEMQNAPEWLRDEITKDEFRFNKETEAIIIDLGLYFGAVFCQSFRQLKWDVIYKPRNFIDVNQPVIIGFKNNISLNPIRIINNCAIKSTEEKFNNKILFDVFQVWTDYLK